MTKFNLKGGVIVIGSLRWKDHLNEKKKDFIRMNWRNENLLLKEEKEINIPIRYGRKSSSWRNAFTMVYCTSVDKMSSQGLLIPLKERIYSFERLYIKAIELAIAEGIYNENNLRINCDWGTIGLLLNPSLKKNNFPIYLYIYEKWIELYQDFSKTFFGEDYKLENFPEIITKDGLLLLDWEEDYDELDFILTTLTVPKPNRLITLNEIALSFKNNDEYFTKNKAHKIITFQDEEIDRELKQIEDT